MFRRSLVLLALLVAAPPPASASWRAPVDGLVVARFRLGPDPYAAGQRRGIDLAVAAGAEVRAPCRGRVTFAGSLPPAPGAPHGAGVALRCGSLSATVLGLAQTAVRRGAELAPGTILGTAAGPRVRLGARRAGGRRAYVDPLTLLRVRRGQPVPPGGARRIAQRPGRTPSIGPPRGGAPAPVAVRVAPARHPLTSAAGEPAHLPLAAWCGLALVAVALPASGLRAHGRRACARRIATPRAESTI